MSLGWYDEVPDDWGYVSLRYLTRSVTGGTPKRSNQNFWDGDIPWVSPKDMKSSEIKDSKEYITEQGINQSSAALVPKNSLIIVTRSGILERTIPVAVTTSPVAINQDIRAYIPDNEYISARYLQLFITSHEDMLLNLWRKQGATVQSLDSDAMAETRFPVPPKSVQRKTVEYCQNELTKIDELSGLQRELFDLLDEKRRALVAAAVTGHVNCTQGGGEIRKSDTTE